MELEQLCSDIPSRSPQTTPSSKIVSGDRERILEIYYHQLLTWKLPTAFGHLSVQLLSIVRN